MPEPFYSEATERVYTRLPEVYRREDIPQNWQFKKWISGIGEQAADIDTLISRFTYTTQDSGGAPGDTSDLVDPALADAAWLPWLAQLVGVKLNTTLSIADQRLQISGVDFLGGTKMAMATVAKTVLTGSKFINIYDHTITASAIGAAGQWDVLIVTVASETVSSPSAAIIAAGAKPAGIKLWEETFSSDWAELEAALPTWDDWETEDWTGIEEVGL